MFRPNILANLKCIPEYLNEFGARGGFEAITNLIASEGMEKQISLTDS